MGGSLGIAALWTAFGHAPLWPDQKPKQINNNNKPTVNSFVAVQHAEKAGHHSWLALEWSEEGGRAQWQRWEGEHDHGNWLR